ncbi:hypothetical protein BLJ79_12800 [Arthrobacter sp. UCD-GKA]|uniref:tyrosine-type recombinase/integrase n=1 Tax=Arthrobacter sp. UCD-GKA TaxID=1913576 RepID=UPI0008DDF379|nr:tyrosine-type recombinase/integrase [Arthrobacter sp. UCD-GKA]OIH84329.1 hypothetical protein BLJ79_12800 [Arthrobacter sp. UCD-GKA]
MFGLIAGTGMLTSETLALKCDDVDMNNGIITIRAGKRGRVRLVPLHPSALEPLGTYAADREHRYGLAEGYAPFFRTDRSNRISYGAADHTFSVLRRQLGWSAVGRTRTPRFHDLRHRMVVRRVEAGHAQNLNVDAKIPVLATHYGPRRGEKPLLVFFCRTRTDENHFRAVRSLFRSRSRCIMRSVQIRFPQLVQDFFLQRLITQRGLNARTMECYRDAFELLFCNIEGRTGSPPSMLQVTDLDVPMVLDFLDHLENERQNSVRTRNARMAAIHSFMRYAAVRDPASLPIPARVLDIPAKRFDRPVLGYLSREQIAAISAAPDRSTWSGHLDAAMLTTAYNPGPAFRRSPH